MLRRLAVRASPALAIQPCQPETSEGGEMINKNWENRCVFCGAESGQPCIGPRGGKMRGVHFGRIIIDPDMAKAE